MNVTVNGVVRSARVGTMGHVLLTNGSEIEGVVLPSGRVVWTGPWGWDIDGDDPSDAEIGVGPDGDGWDPNPGSDARP